MDYKSPDSCQIPDLDKIYNSIFPSANDRYFVDVGAFDGITFSNTWALAEAGWGGLCVEPLPKLRTDCANNHKQAGHNNVNTFEACVGSYTGQVDLYIVDDCKPLATTNKNVVDTNLWGETYTSSVKSSIFTLDDLFESLTMFNITVPIGFDVLSIDTEGSDLDVLRGFTIDVWHPTLVIVESHEFHPDVRRRFAAADINKYFEETAYVKIYSDALNSMFLYSGYVNRLPRSI